MYKAVIMSAGIITTAIMFKEPTPMTKSQLINEIAAQAGLTKTAAEKALDAMTAAMLKAFAAGDSVYLDSIGRLMVVNRDARNGRNPKTGDPLIIPASKTVKLYPSKHLKDAVNG